MIVVNGTVWPSLNVVPQRYRLRLLAGADSRTFNLSLWAIPAGTTLDPNSQTYINDVRAVAREIPFYQIGAEQGFLPKVVKIKSGAAVALPGDGTEPTASCVPGANPGDATCMRGLTMVPAERADVIVDFTGLAAGTTVQMINDSSDVPFYGFPVDPSDAVNAASTGQIMRFVVTAPTATTPRDTSTAPASLVMASEPAYTAAITATKRISLLEEESKQICVQVAGDGSLTVAQTFTQPQADPMAACATANAIPFG
ncbi:MAG: copper oxidase, partial [Proteobacteria bacterium]|nr:copper oxidase [Pseudomonadota bacterium]